MNIAYDLTAAVSHTAGLIYPVIIWMLGTATTHSSIILIAANRVAMSLACVYAVIALTTLLKNRKKMIAGTLNIAVRNNFYTIAEPEKKKDKIGRFLSEEKLIQFNSAINQFLIDKKPFLQQKYSLRDLASDVDIPVNYLSAFINRHYKINYSDFINSYRVTRAREMIMNGDWKHKTLEAIASESGFNNRNTFTAAFRKETGQSPSEFLRDLKKSQQADKSFVPEGKKILV